MLLYTQLTKYPNRTVTNSFQIGLKNLRVFKLQRSKWVVLENGGFYTISA